MKTYVVVKHNAKRPLALDQNTIISQSMNRVLRNLLRLRILERRKDHRGVSLISDALPFGRLWLWRADYAKFGGPVTRCCDSRLR